jgi:hypothetical protein
MASIRKLKSGSWNVQVRHKGSPTVSKTFPSKKEATAWLRDFNRELTAQGKPCKPLFAGNPTHPVSQARTTLGTALQRYSEEVTVNKRGRTAELYRIRVVSKYLGHLLMAEIEPHPFSQYRDTRLQVVTGDTVRRELALLSHLSNESVQPFRL